MQCAAQAPDSLRSLAGSDAITCAAAQTERRLLDRAPLEALVPYLFHQLEILRAVPLRNLSGRHYVSARWLLTEREAHRESARLSDASVGGTTALLNGHLRVPRWPAVAVCSCAALSGDGRVEDPHVPVFRVAHCQHSVR